MENETKKCSKCGLDKVFSKYRKYSNFKDGYHDECRSCEDAEYASNKISHKKDLSSSREYGEHDSNSILNILIDLKEILSVDGNIQLTTFFESKNLPIIVRDILQRKSIIVNNNNKSRKYLKWEWIGNAPTIDMALMLLVEIDKSKNSKKKKPKKIIKMKNEGIVNQSKDTIDEKVLFETLMLAASIISDSYTKLKINQILNSYRSIK
jgi:hypothetical protein